MDDNETQNRKTSRSVHKSHVIFQTCLKCFETVLQVRNRLNQHFRFTDTHNYWVFYYTFYRTKVFSASENKIPNAFRLASKPQYLTRTIVEEYNI